MDKDQIAAIERQMQEEHKKDMEALERLKRFIPSSGINGNASDVHQVPLQSISKIPVTPLVLEEGTSLKHAIRDIMNHDPSIRWTNVKMLKYLEDIKFELKAKKPIYSIGQATQKLVDGGEIKLVKKGSGNAPNIYRGLNQLEQAAREASENEEA